jgi:hypothetical protein
LEGSLLSLLINVRVARKNIKVANTIAYLVTKKKSFKTLAPGQKRMKEEG